MESLAIYEAALAVPGWLDRENVEGFMRLSLPASPLVFECGTYCGRSATVFSLIWPDARIFTCDPINEPARLLPKGATFYNCKGKDVSWGRPIDLLFVDDSHLYPDIRDNFEKFSPFVRSGGYVVFHDYHFPTAAGVKEFVDELGGCEIDGSGEYGMAVWRKP